MEQEFNSLDAQRDSCAAYILSMKHEGWRLVPTRYDDGGFSGGNLARPGLQNILRDISRRQIDMVVVYKIDRLTRSLMDFGKIIGVLDGVGASFVSVTQSFNTQTSMGRLTLNMLLSFAQFERELGSERVRDKIAASRARGLWTGGSVPFGYDLVNRRLEINPVEAEQVRFIFKTYVELKSVRELIGTLEAHGIVTKRTIRANGKVRGGIPFRRGNLYHFLRNVTYRGLTHHSGNFFPGQHEAIVDDNLWARAQETLRANAIDRKCAINARSPSLLAGLIWDGSGRRMTPTHTQKGAKRYRYYMSVDVPVYEGASGPCKRFRLVAGDLETLVRDRLVKLLSRSEALSNEWIAEGASALEISKRIERFRLLAEELQRKSRSPLRAMMLQICRSVTVHEDRVELRLDPEGFAALAGFKSAVLTDSMVTIPCRMRQGSADCCLVLLPDRTDGLTIIDQTLTGLLARAYGARQILEAKGKETDMSNQRRTYLSRLARFTYLAPDIVAAILRAQQPASLTATRLRQLSTLPADWEEQRKAFGFKT